jgi:hypothetical protein
MKRYLIPTLSSLLLLIALTFSTSAQDVTDLQWLDVRLWPEYDNPELLVILVGETAQPNQPVLMPLPPGARIHAVATTSADGGLVQNAWEPVTIDGVNFVSMTPDGAQFQIEYYAPIAADGDQRNIDFMLPANFISAGNAAIEIVIPPSASEVVFDPEATSSNDQGSQGHVLMREVGPVTADQTINQSIVYNNETGAFTFTEQSLPAAPATDSIPTALAPTNTSDNRNLILIGLAGLAAVLIAGGAYGLWRSRSSDEEDSESASQTPSRKKGERKGRKQKGGAGQDRFCRKCGAGLSSSDQFCRKCGEKRL